MRATVFGIITLFLLSSTAHSITSLHPPVISPVSWKAPAFQYRSLDGKTHQLSELRGKVVVIDFWGTWCAGCVEELPTLQQLYDRFRSDPKVAFVVVSQNDSLEKVKAFVSKNRLTMPFYYVGTDPIPAPLSPSAWPTTYFVSADGIVKGEYLGGADWSDESAVRYIEQLKQAVRP